MKRLLLAALALVALASVAAAAPRMAIKEVGWRICNANANGVWCRDTSFTSVAASVVDTTAWFTLDGLWLPDAQAKAAADSLIIGYVVISADSSADFTANLTAITSAFDAGALRTANAGGNTAADVISKNIAATIIGGNSKLVTTGDKVVLIPIELGQRLPNSIGTSAYLAAMAPLRMRVTATTGVLTAARCFVAYQREGNP